MTMGARELADLFRDAPSVAVSEIVPDRVWAGEVGWITRCLNEEEMATVAKALLLLAGGERMTEKCDVPDCEGMGRAGNANIIDGKRVCDYCHAKRMRRTHGETAPQKQED